MAEDPKADAPPLTLAGLRRRGTPRPAIVRQPDLFDDLFDSHAAATFGPSLGDGRTPEPAARVEISVAAVHSRNAEVLATSLPVSPAETRLETPALRPAPAARPQTWTVSGLVRHVRGLVEQGYEQVTVEGEISNWRPAASGHCYFTVKDAGAQLSAVLFRRQASLLRFRPSDGDAVRLHGQLSIYESRGQMQIIVEWIEQVGFGALLAQVQRLKEALRREGLFDRKRPLPPFPRCIGIVTSLQGAALRDIVKVCKRRHAAVQLLIYPAAVQGPNCPAEVAAGLRWFSAHPDRAEVVLVARGGGSWEDLHGFDDEGVARAIAACALPVITGIGHAPDATIADAAADVCAPTPSAAAELLTAAHHRVEERVARLHARLLRSGSFELLRAGQRLARLSAATTLRRVEDSLNRRAQRVDELSLRAEAAERRLLRRQQIRLLAMAERLNRQSPNGRLAATRQHLGDLRLRLRAAAKTEIDSGQTRVSTASTRLGAMSPLRVLERGYALVYGPDGHLLRSSYSLGEGEEITARLAEGTLRARVLDGSAKPA